LAAGIGDPGYYSVDSVYFSASHLRFLRKARLSNVMNTEKKGVLRETSPFWYIRSDKRLVFQFEREGFLVFCSTREYARIACEGSYNY
jgi:hypothetical protein